MGLVASSKLRIRLNRIPERLETIAESFRRGGYATFGVSDNVNVSAAEGFEQGFDRFRSLPYSAAEAVNREVLAWRSELEAAPKSFLYLHYMDPHEPYHERAPWYEPGESSTRDVRAYDSEIRYVDEAIRELYTELGWSRDTLVVVTSDHGEEFGDHGDTDHGKTLYAEVIDVPLLFWGLEAWTRRGVVEERVSTLDILPTLEDLLGLEAAIPREGSSLVPLLAGSDPVRHDRMVYSHLYRKAGTRTLDGERGDLSIRSMIRADWKLILSNARGTQLYDLSRDREERRNRLPEDGEHAAAMRRSLERLEAGSRRYEAEARDFEIDPDLQETLRSLGYAR